MEDPDLPKAFQAHVRMHNWSVVWAICISVFGTALLWPFIYLMIYTVGLVFVSVAFGADSRLPEDFPLYFAAAVLASFPICLGLNWIIHRHFYHIVQQYALLRWGLEILVAPHRMTLSVPGHFRAFCFLSDRDKRLIVRLLRTIDEQRRLEIRRLEMEVPRHRRRRRILEALSLMDLTNLARIDDRLYLTLRNAEVRKLLYPRVKIRRKPPWARKK